jgi:hypothetical protein
MPAVSCPARVASRTPTPTTAVAATLSLLALAGPALAQLPIFTPTGSFALPQTSGSLVWDVGPDGRVIALAGDSILQQTAPNASTSSTIGAIPTGLISTFGASFIRVSQAGTIAIGDGNFGASARVHLVDRAALSPSTPTSTTSLALGNFSARWSGQTLLVAGAGSNFVPFLARVNVTDAAIPLTATTVLTSIGGASGGVAIAGPTLYTGVGFSGGGLSTGDVRSFALSTLLTASAPTNYSTGTPVPGGPAFSASPLATDRLGNLYVGDGRFSTDASSGVIAIDPLTGQRLTLSPEGGDRRYGVAFNTLTDELLVTTGGTAYRYSIPTPTAAALLGLGLLASTRRRRD